MVTNIYHITDLSNLPSVMTSGGLYSVNTMPKKLTYTSIAYKGIQDRRATTTVPCSRGGVLHDYVPFYFAPRSPMLYTINRGNVPSCPNGQKTVVHLVSTVETVKSAGVDFVFTDGHGIMALTHFFDDLKDLNKVDWPLMKDRYWFEKIGTGLIRMMIWIAKGEDRLSSLFTSSYLCI